MTTGTVSVSLDDKYTLDRGRVFLTGTQALVRLALMQRRRDLAAGLNTAGYVTGYRGSPLGSVDMEFWRAQNILHDHQIKFLAAVNEDLAATAVWGTQQANLFPGATHDGVFAIWYGKGPGVDRSGDAFRHANLAGTSPHGGVLAVVGDDPSGKSSTVPSQSEHALMDAWMPVLAPCNVQEVLDYGLLGWAMSRYSGCWVAMKTLSDIMDSAASVQADPDPERFVCPDTIAMPPDGLHARWPDPKERVEQRLQRYKIPAVRAFARANNIDRTLIDPPEARLGIMATGKAWLDTLQALEDLGINDKRAHALGIRLRKTGMPWPLEPEGLAEFAHGLSEIIIVDEKRPVLEPQIKEQLYHWPESRRPLITAKHDPDGVAAIPQWDELNAHSVARVIAPRLQAHGMEVDLSARQDHRERMERVQRLASETVRLPYFCSGCPHNSSTIVPEGSRATAGIGCHYMVNWMDRETETFTQMGAEGANWLGRSAFTETPHMFVNIGDGTLFHSGTLAIRAGVASGASVTYKILYNDAVAMTGGQPVDGPMTVPMVTQQVYAEGIRRIAVVSDEPDKYATGTRFASGTTIHHRDDLDQVQRDIRLWPGVSVLIFDQTCAAEKRRRRKRGTFPDPDKRAFINTLVCEGCGDCGAVSNCVAITPEETLRGRKRSIDQASCNKDFRCVDGFCPSFVTVQGATLKKPAPFQGTGPSRDPRVLPEPVLPELDKPWNIIMTGIGGTGVVTVGHLLAMAAHIEERGVSVLDVAGLAQKNGAVFTHLRIAPDAGQLRATRITPGSAHMLLGFDMITSASRDTLTCLSAEITSAVVNTHQTMTAAFTANPDLVFPFDGLDRAIRGCTRDRGYMPLDAHHLANRIMGDSIAANVMLTGYAWQKGLIPLGLAAIEQAIHLNNVAADFNLKAFEWGRRLAHDPALMQRICAPEDLDAEADHVSTLVDRFSDDLRAYQNNALASRYRAVVERVSRAEKNLFPEQDARDARDELTRGVARNLYKLMAFKDEYEVARLFTDGRFQQELARQFEGDHRITYHMAPPLLAPRDPRTGIPRKMAFGAWIRPLLRLLASLRGLRGSPFDIFGYSAERQAERHRIDAYVQQIEQLLPALSHANYATAVQIACLPEGIRGFGHIKQASAQRADACLKDLLAAFRSSGEGSLQEAKQ